MSEEIKETLDDIKRHLDYVEATKQSSIRDNEMKTMYEYITSLQQKVEQLENIRKEAIEYVYKHIQEYDVDGTFTNLDEFDFIASPQTLLNILSKGSEKE